MGFIPRPNVRFSLFKLIKGTFLFENIFVLFLKLYILVIDK